MPTGEVSTHGIVQDAMKSGKKVFVPYIHKSQGESSQRYVNMMDMLALHSQEDLVLLKQDAWGIPTMDETSITSRENAFSGVGVAIDTAGEMSDTSEFSGLDLVLLPGVAFDSENRRLGHGKGFYDRYLQRYRDIASSRGKTRMPFLGKLIPLCCTTPNG